MRDRSICAVSRGNRLDPFDGHLRAAETAVARVEVFVAVGVHVRFARMSALGVVLGRGADVHALADAFRDPANLAAAGVPIRRKEADVGKQNVAREIGAFQQQARRDPALASGPSGDGRRREKLLAQRAGG